MAKCEYCEKDVAFQLADSDFTIHALADDLQSFDDA